MMGRVVLVRVLTRASCLRASPGSSKSGALNSDQDVLKELEVQSLEGPHYELSVF